MADRTERACQECGSLLHHELDCKSGKLPDHIRPSHGPGVCEIPGCSHPRHYYAQRDWHAPVCAIHALDRIHKALADV